MNKCGISNFLSERFAAMSFLCACMIVFFHATPASEIGSFTWWFFHLFGREGICCIAVPYFFACSGYFLARHYGEEGWWGREVLKRVKSLIVPYYIWMAIGIAFGILVGYAKRQYFNVEMPDGFLSLPHWEKVMLYLGLHPFQDIGVLWYVRTLFLMVLVSPLIFYCLRRPLLTLGVLFSLHLVLCYLFAILDINMYYLLDRFLSERGLFYFCLGAALCVGSHGKDLKLPLHTGILCLIMGMMLLVIKNLLKLSSLAIWAGVVEAVSVLFLIAGVWATFIIPRWVRGFYKYSFPIFLMHNIFLSLVSMVFMCVGLRNMESMQIPIALIRAACSIIGSIVVAMAMRRVCLGVANVSFGGR